MEYTFQRFMNNKTRRGIHYVTIDENEELITADAE
jgi:hypothetical protein